MTVRKELIKQINLTITVIKTINQKNPTPMVKNILKRYEEAKEFILQSSDGKFEEDLSHIFLICFSPLELDSFDLLFLLQ